MWSGVEHDGSGQIFRSRWCWTRQSGTGGFGFLATKITIREVIGSGVTRT